MDKPIPVSIVSGFLGAGKTTLLNRILSDPRGVRYGVLVNDFGAINIDAELIREARPDRISLANGCVCCTIRDDLLAAAFELARGASPPDQIIVETSGVSSARAVADAFFGEAAARLFEVDGIFCLIDAENFPDLAFADTELAIDQAAVADIVLLNKCDLASEKVQRQIEQTLRDALPGMRIVRTVNADLPRDVLTGIRSVADVSRASGVHCRHGRDGNEHDHDAAFVAWSWRAEEPVALAAFKAAIKALPPTVLRSKGILRFREAAGQHALFQLVGKRSSLQFAPDQTAARDSALVAIGRRGEFAPDELDAVVAQYLGDRPGDMTPGSDASLQTGELQ